MTPACDSITGNMNPRSAVALLVIDAGIATEIVVRLALLPYGQNELSDY
jgi:hypothetical protein